MQTTINISKTLTASLSALIVLSACSSESIQTSDRLDYRSAASVNTLELPPDLARSAANNKNGATTLSQYRNHANEKVVSKVLQHSADARIVIESDKSYMKVTANADFVWRSVLSVLSDAGLALEFNNPEAGLIETKWSENRADVPDGFLRSTISKIGLGSAFSAGTRDMFRIRLERNSPESISVYITHYGMRDKSSGNDDQFHTWIERPRDSELEAALLNRLMVKVGGGSIQAQNNASVERSMLISDTSDMSVNRNIQDVWVQAGNILDDGNQFKITSQDAQARTYNVSWNNPNKPKSKLKFWSKAKPQLFKVSFVEHSDKSTMINVISLDGASSADEQALLTKIKDAFI
ncbi:lipoprotein [Gammaproteobacteria bacterium]|nr:lipoprotein [Gammaproteobacteria bacterium]